MSREIKFRIWNNEQKDYGDGFALIDILPMEVYIGNKKNLILEQYTGLKDKNGVEIYEGDIVRFNQHYDESECVADIIFAECSFVAHYHKSNTVEEWTSLPLNIEDQETMEVIGNIHETPELLK